MTSKTGRLPGSSPGKEGSTQSPSAPLADAADASPPHGRSRSISSETPPVEAKPSPGQAEPGAAPSSLPSNSSASSTSPETSKGSLGTGSLAGRRRSSLAQSLARMNPFANLRDASGHNSGESNATEHGRSVSGKRSKRGKSSTASGNAAGESRPSANTTFNVGVTEERGPRRTMEDTHSYVYDFAGVEDQGYFAIFDGHAGKQAADWCGKKVHHVFEQAMKQSPDTGVPDLWDKTYMHCDGMLADLTQRNSGCTAVTALLAWEQRDGVRQRVLYTANVGDARIVLCRKGKAFRLSYDHKGSDENEGKRIAEAGGLILNNRVNGVLAVTRALGDSYMKDLITGHPFTTETVLTLQHDEFIILACDGLWDVCTDQEAVDLVRDIHDPQEASRLLCEHALKHYSTDNLSCMIVRLDPIGTTAEAKTPATSLSTHSEAVPSSSSEPAV